MHTSGLILVGVDILVSPRSQRLVTALAPVLVANIDSVNLDLVLSQLAPLGLGQRLAWLAESVAAALQVAGDDLPPGWGPNVRRAALLLGELAKRVQSAHPSAGYGPDGPMDYFDPTIRSVKTAHNVWHNAGPIAKRWCGFHKL